MTTLNTITSVEAIQAADTKTLIEFYNEFNPEKTIKKFADRPTAEKRCTTLFNELVEEGQIESVKPAKAEKQKVSAKFPTVKTEKKDEKKAEAVEESNDDKTEDTTTNAQFTWPFGDPKVKSSPQGKMDIEAGVKKAPTEKVIRKSSTAGHASNAAGIAASWSNPDVASARLTRNGVSVEVKGNVTEHKSTREAFRHHRLMDSKHIRFRGLLKAAGTAVYVEKDVEYKFTIIG